MAKGAVVAITNLVGNLNPAAGPGTDRSIVNFAQTESRIHHDETNAN